MDHREEKKAIMLESISWKMYIEGTAALLGCYYAGVAAICYRKEMKQFFAGSKLDRVSTYQAAGSTHEDNYIETSFDELEKLVKDIDQTLTEAGPKPEGHSLIAQLQSLLDKNTHLLTPAYRVAIFNHIQTKAKDICGVRIDESDFVRLE